MRATQQVDLGVSPDVAAPAALRVRTLRVTAARSGRCILDDLDLTVAPGSITGVVGESGSGKTTLLRSFLGAIADGLTSTGQVELVDGETAVSLLDASPRQLRTVRSQRIAYLAQDPARGLTPTMRIGAAIAERLPGARDRGATRAAVGELLASVGLPDDDEFVRRYPFALSGGQAQRVALARALAATPDVLLLDEPTTGLDVVTQAELLDELHRQHQRTPRTTVIVSHDLAVIARLADDVVVLRNGSIVEAGDCRATLRAPQHAYTRELVDACPDPLRVEASRVPGRAGAGSGDGAGNRAATLCVRGLVATHRRSRHAPVVAAHDLDLDLHAGTCVALVGASGSGKSTIARTIVGAHVPDAGAVELDGRPLPARLDDRAVVDRWRVQWIPQDPTSSLNPRRAVGRAVADVVRRCRTTTDGATANATVIDNDIDAAVNRLFREVGLDPSLAARRPGALSGGERQRVAIARALAASPAVLICDEVTSALDVSVQAGVVRLLRSLVDDHDLAMLFITHDLGLVHDIADEVAVLDDGQVCEMGPVDAVVSSPRHAATRTLLAASPSLSAELSPFPDITDGDR
ncbi:MAG: ABC transporter ATP-binding protein [Actinomycetota bacterium]